MRTREKIAEIQNALASLEEIYERELEQLRYENEALSELVDERESQLKHLEEFAQEKLDEKDRDIAVLRDLFAANNAIAESFKGYHCLSCEKKKVEDALKAKPEPRIPKVGDVVFVGEKDALFQENFEGIVERKYTVPRPLRLIEESPFQVWSPDNVNTLPISSINPLNPKGDEGGWSWRWPTLEELAAFEKQEESAKTSSETGGRKQ